MLVNVWEPIEVRKHLCFNESVWLLQFLTHEKGEKFVTIKNTNYWILIHPSFQRDISTQKAIPWRPYETILYLFIFTPPHQTYSIVKEQILPLKTKWNEIFRRFRDDIITLEEKQLIQCFHNEAGFGFSPFKEIRSRDRLTFSLGGFRGKIAVNEHWTF